MNIFDSISKNWWIKKNVCQPLHLINNIRFNYIKSKINIQNKKILDIGCGGGILTEKLAKHGSNITAIDKSKELIKIAKNRLHSTYKINYINIDTIDFLKKNKEKFDTILCMELLEHIKNKKNIIELINNVMKKNSILIISSLNKNLITYFKIILLAEYIFKKMPKNTHFFENFIKTKQIESYSNKIKIVDIKEIYYNHALGYSTIKKNISINYILTLKKC